MKTWTTSELAIEHCPAMLERHGLGDGKPEHELILWHPFVSTREKEIYCEECGLIARDNPVTEKWEEGVYEIPEEPSWTDLL